MYPTADQGVLIAKQLGCCRFVYNRGLNLTNRTYEDDGVSLSAYDLINRPPALKARHGSMKGCVPANGRFQDPGRSGRPFPSPGVCRRRSLSEQKKHQSDRDHLRGHARRVGGD
ncbi:MULTISPECIES: helix-turn-helix domain-containing protein [unclassified Methanoculleus]|uniref:helix-turn-helix domain-containing protein n=1 Tax=unclassified Methanoculleus TaxID=2619537 RepID=UPI003743E8B6